MDQQRLENELEFLYKDFKAFCDAKKVTYHACRPIDEYQNYLIAKCLIKITDLMIEVNRLKILRVVK